MTDVNSLETALTTIAPPAPEAGMSPRLRLLSAENMSEVLANPLAQKVIRAEPVDRKTAPFFEPFVRETFRRKSFVWNV
jgi:hypothetical protein